MRLLVAGAARVGLSVLRPFISPPFVISASTYRPVKSARFLVLARDKEQARIVFRYVRATLRSIPVLAKLVQSWRADEIELRNRIISRSAK